MSLWKVVELTVEVIVAPVLSVVVIGTGTVPLVVPFPPALVPLRPPAPPETVELPAPVGSAPAAPPLVRVEVELALDPAPPVATTTVAVPDEVAVTVVAEVEPDATSGKRGQ